MNRVWPILLGSILCHGGAMAGALDLGSTGDHVRVILDTSKSMCGAACGWPEPANDPGRLSVLSTLLLHDLLKPDPNKAEHPDSFAVIPFGPEPWTGDQPPSSTVTPRRARGMAARRDLIEALSATRTPFDAMNTYYSPSIELALADLPALSSVDGAALTRTIVLITDGLSVKPQADLAYLTDRLLPALAAKQTRLFAILFGPDAVQRGAAFFADIRQADEANVRAGRYGEHVFPGYFIVRTGDELPATMIRLFSDGFGYLHLPDDRQEWIGTGRDQPAVGLNLYREVGPTEAAIVALRLDRGGSSNPKPPRASLSPPAGGSVNLQSVLEASEPGGSYALRWELKPSPGDYPFRLLDGGDASLFVLRPTNLTVGLREHRAADGRPGRVPSCFAPGALVTMADRPCQLDFLVTSAAGTKGIPPKLTLRYWTRQPRPGGLGDWNINDADGVGIADTHHWDDLAAGGRRYSSQTQFSRNQIPGDAERSYRAHVTVQVKLENRTVAERGDDDPFEVQVYPRLGLSPQPPVIKIKNPASGALGPYEQACTAFDLIEDFGTRLESAQGNPLAAGGLGFNVRAFLVAEQPRRDGALRGARFTLDGESIGFETGQSPRGAPADFEWSRGRQRAVAELVQRPEWERNRAGGRHTLCVTLGPNADGDPLAPPVLRLRFILDHPPYDHFDVIEGLRAEVLVAAAPVLGWWSALPFLLLLLGLPLALWLPRVRCALPPDLGYGIATADEAAEFMVRRLPSPHPLRRLFAPRAERPVLDPQGGLLGWVRPEVADLYGLRLVPGAVLSHRDGTGVEPSAAGLYLLEVHQPYRLRNGVADLWLRMQFL